MRSKPTMPVAEKFLRKDLCAAPKGKQIENQTAKEQHHVDLVLLTIAHPQRMSTAMPSQGKIEFMEVSY